MTPRIKRKLLYLGFMLLTLVVPYLMMVSNPYIEASRSVCPFKLLTGIPCPGCGITKSIISCYQGDLIKSLSYHIFGPLVILFCMASLLTLTAEIFTQRDYFNKVVYNAKLGYALAFVLITYHATRLIVFFAHNNIGEILKGSIWG